MFGVSNATRRNRIFRFGVYTLYTLMALYPAIIFQHGHALRGGKCYIDETRYYYVLLRISYTTICVLLFFIFFLSVNEFSTRRLALIVNIVCMKYVDLSCCGPVEYYSICTNFSRFRCTVFLINLFYFCRLLCLLRLQSQGKTIRLIGLPNSTQNRFIIAMIRHYKLVYKLNYPISHVLSQLPDYNSGPLNCLCIIFIVIILHYCFQRPANPQQSWVVIFGDRFKNTVRQIFNTDDFYTIGFSLNNLTGFV